MRDIIYLIENGHENEYLDFKAKDYVDKGEFLIDIMSMANSMDEGDKYIIIGVKDKINGEKEIIGIEETKEQAEFQQLVNENIEPKIKFEYRTIQYKDKILGYYEISKDNKDRPYMAKKQYTKGRNIRQGECFIRKNSTNSIALRRDYDIFYNERRDIKISIKDYVIVVQTIKNPNPFGPYVDAPFKINLINKGNSKIIFLGGYILIKDNDGKVVCRNEIVGHRKIDRNLDFKLELDGKNQYLDDLFLSFSSEDCVRLGMDEHGYCSDLFNVEIILEDTEGYEYKTSQEGVVIKAKGDILHKVRRLRGVREFKFRDIFKK
ncbi:MAG: ATP-binding protein [Clostridiaceae bacterium]|nr:ATP-binding protein [Clostridiaceae bacterium]